MLSPTGGANQQFMTSNQLYASAYSKSLVSKVVPSKMKKQPKVQNIFAQRRGHSVMGIQNNKLPSLDNSTQFKANTFSKRLSSLQ